MAQFVVVVPDTAVQRIQNAVQVVSGLAAPATGAQVAALVVKYLRALCMQVEAAQREAAVPTAAETAVATDFPSP